ncbi:MAG: LA2681 family HEPN domain-containing protein [Clostridia bacterium]|nr:LA2681 family HEPN domain-containing protein [Clostridia bacterium]
MKRANKCQKHINNPFSEISIELSYQFDLATINRDVAKLKELLSEAENYLNIGNNPSQARMYYSLGTANEELAELTNSINESSYKKVLYYYRKSLKLVESDECRKEEYKPYITGLKMNLYTNYANTLDRCGRKIAAIEQYKKVLSVNKNFGMALGNLGRAYQQYAVLEYDKYYRDLFHCYAYQCLTKAIECDDPNTYDDAKAVFENSIKIYAPEFIEHVLSKKVTFKKYSYDNPEELSYRIWCLKNGLFLNTLNDLPTAEFCFAADVIQLPDMIVNINDKPIFHGMFSQLKQEYIYARYLYYSTLAFDREPHFADKETEIKAYTDYAQYSIRIEKLKTSFKTLYGLFDKIAYFIENYFNLGIKEQEINFRSIWQDSGERGKKYSYKNVLNPDKNFALSSLYWISKDFFEKFEDSPNPELKRIKDIRNSLEHKYTKIYNSFFKDEIEEYGDGLALYVSEEEFYETTMMLLKILREAIISLSLCVNVAEEPKREEAKNKVVVPISLLDYDDNWKI